MKICVILIVRIYHIVQLEHISTPLSIWNHYDWQQYIIFVQYWSRIHVCSVADTGSCRGHWSTQAPSCTQGLFLAATKQLYEWFSPSVRLSVRLSVCPSVRLSVTPFWLCSHHPIIMNISGVITSDKSDVHAKGQGQRSKVKVTEVTTQIFVSGL